MSLFLLCMLGGLQPQFEDILRYLLPGFSSACVKSSFDADCSGSFLFILFSASTGQRYYELAYVICCS